MTVSQEIPAPVHRPRREIIGFLTVGVIAVVIDFLIFNLCLVWGWPVWLANGLALLVSMTVAFAGNYRWSFAHREVKSLWHAYTTFAAINLASVVLIEVVVVAAEVWMAPSPLVLNLVKAAATAVATVARFFAYKKWVFF